MGEEEEREESLYDTQNPPSTTQEEWRPLLHQMLRRTLQSDKL